MVSAMSTMHQMCYEPFGVYGVGNNDLLRYSYDRSLNQCRAFLWSGRQAQRSTHIIENRFNSLIHCKNFCMP